MTDERERLRTARERAERHAADMDEAAKGGPKGGYFVDPTAAGEIAEGLRDYGEILGEKERALDESALKDAVAGYRRDSQAFVAELSGVAFVQWPFVYPPARCLGGTDKTAAMISLREHEARDED